MFRTNKIRRKGVPLRNEWCPCEGLEARRVFRWSRVTVRAQSSSTKTDNQPKFTCMSQVEQAVIRRHYATLCDSGTSLDKDNRLL